MRPFSAFYILLCNCLQENACDDHSSWCMSTDCHCCGVRWCVSASCGKSNTQTAPTHTHGCAGVRAYISRAHFHQSANQTHKIQHRTCTWARKHCRNNWVNESVILTFRFEGTEQREKKTTQLNEIEYSCAVSYLPVHTLVDWHVLISIRSHVFGFECTISHKPVGAPIFVCFFTTSHPLIQKTVRMTVVASFLEPTPNRTAHLR